MAAPDLAAADPVAVLLAWLKNHPQTIDLLGGPEHVTGLPETPWPHLNLADGPGGDLRGLEWNVEYEVSFELYGSPEGHPGQAALWRTAVRLAQLVVHYPETVDQSPTDPHISRVRPSGVFAWTPTSAGQPRYTFGVLVVISPPAA